MAYPGTGGPRRIDGPIGYTYAAILVAGELDEVVAGLRGLRFTGWVAPPHDGWVPVVASRRAASMASGRRGVVGVGAELASSQTMVVGLRVVDDRQLLLVVWKDGQEAGRYLSDPSYGLDDDTLAMPYGADQPFAEALGKPEKAEKLAELLAEELDPDSMIESERLSRVLNLLGLPTWLVAVSSLPRRDIPTGPARSDLTRLGGGRTGPAGRLLGRLLDVVRARRPPPPPVTDAPRGVDIDPWLM